MKKILIVGCGFAGAVLAREIADNSNSRITIIDKKNHIGGNCHTTLDKKRNIIIHKYGPHIFHTSDEAIWKYVNRFGKFNNFVNRVKIENNKGIFSMPINLHTINQYFRKKFNPEAAKKYLKTISLKINHPSNFEEKAISMLGKKIYNDFLHGYTKKQWGITPKKISKTILKRLPVRFNYNDNYYNDKYQGVPINGYTEIIKNMLNNKKIKIYLSKSYKKSYSLNFDITIFTGPIDEYFNYKYGRLSYRTVYWKKKNFLKNDYQGNAIINYNDPNVPYTRIIEPQHFNPERQNNGTTIFYEYSKETTQKDIPYYPKRLEKDKIKLNKYLKEIKRSKNIYFLGRLGTYRYLDMHIVIKESLEFFKKNKKILV